MYIHVRIHECIDIRADTCVDMCADMCVDMCADTVCVDMCFTGRSTTYTPPVGAVCHYNYDCNLLVAMPYY